jgi:hypothetical protein
LRSGDYEKGTCTAISSKKHEYFEYFDIELSYFHAGENGSLCGQVSSLFQKLLARRNTHNKTTSTKSEYPARLRDTSRLQRSNITTSFTRASKTRVKISAIDETVVCWMIDESANLYCSPPAFEATPTLLPASFSERSSEIRMGSERRNNWAATMIGADDSDDDIDLNPSGGGDPSRISDYGSTAGAGAGAGAAEEAAVVAEEVAEIEVVIEELPQGAPPGHTKFVRTPLCSLKITRSDGSCTLPGRPLIGKLVLRMVFLPPPKPGLPPIATQDFDKQVKQTLTAEEPLA